MKRVRVVGWGSHHCGDDRAGLWAADALRRLLPPEVDVRTNVAGGADFYDWCQDVDSLVVIDAAQATTGLPPGAVRCVDYRSEPHALEALSSSGTHGIGLADALTLAERLGVLPREVFVYAIGAERFELGEPLSESLRQPLTQLVRLVRSDVLSMVRGES